MFQSGSATSHKDLSDKIRDIAQSRHVSAAVVNAGGAGYAIDDILTVLGGTVLHSFNCTIRVTGVAAGVINAVRIETGGAYTVDPTTVANAVTGGSGAGATIDLTMAETGWTVLIDETTFGANNDYRVMLEGANGGVAGDEVYAGWRTQQSGTAPNDFYNMRPSISTGFNALLDYVDQPGFFQGPYMNSQNNGGFPILFWMQADDRHITVVSKPENASITIYASMSFGLLDPYATQTEYPYPIYVAGNSPRNIAFFTTNANEQGAISSVVELINYRDTNYPLYIRDAAGVMQPVSNKEFTSNLGTTPETNRVCTPLSFPSITILDSVDEIVGHQFNGVYFHRIAFGTSNVTDAVPVYTLQPTPSTPDDQRILFPIVPVFSPSDGDDVLGEIPGVFWTIGGGVNSEDVIVNGGERYRIFLGGRRSQIYSWFALRES